jgi:hypothetical protein
VTTGEQYDDRPTAGAGAGEPGGFGPLWAAVVVLALDSLGLIGAGIFLLVRSTGHDATNHQAAVTQGVFALFGALIFAVLAIGLAPPRVSLLARTPSFILEAILVPVSIGLFQSGRPAIGSPMLASALIAIGGLAVGSKRLH